MPVSLPDRTFCSTAAPIRAHYRSVAKGSSIMFRRSVARALPALAVLFVAAQAIAEVTPKDYEDALSLRDRWEYLTRDIVFPAQWVKGGHDFYYRKTVEGGFAFVRENADTGEKKSGFDQA